VCTHQSKSDTFRTAGAQTFFSCSRRRGVELAAPRRTRGVRPPAGPRDSGAVGTGAAVLQATLSEDPPKLTRPCVEIASSYVDGLGASPEMRELIIPGGDGQSITTDDPEARLCGIRPETLDRIAKQPTTHARDDQSAFGRRGRRFEA
jgi:hypothetical protein